MIAQSLQSHNLGAALLDKAALHSGAVALIHRVGSSLSEYVHFHVCVVDGVFEELLGLNDDTDAQALACKVICPPSGQIAVGDNST